MKEAGAKRSNASGECSISHSRLMEPAALRLKGRIG